LKNWPDLAKQIFLKFLSENFDKENNRLRRLVKKLNQAPEISRGWWAGGAKVLPSNQAEGSLRNYFRFPEGENLGPGRLTGRCWRALWLEMKALRLHLPDLRGGLSRAKMYPRGDQAMDHLIRRPGQP
jgi:hypothetical protein